MKAKKWVRLTALILVFCMLTLNAVSCKSSEVNKSSIKVKDGGRVAVTLSVYKPIGQENGMDVVAENDNYQLLLNTATCTLNVLVKKTGFLWKTNLSDGEFSADTVQDVIAQYKSQFAVTFYDDRGKVNTYYSYPQSVSKQQFEFASIENGVRVSYRIGDTGEDKIYPDVISQSTLEKVILPKLTQQQQDRILRFFILTKFEELSDADKVNITTKYPLIKKEPIYLPKKANIKIRNELIGYFKQAEMTLEGLNQEYDKVGYKNKAQLAPCFTVGIDYQLMEQGLRSNVAVDEIKSTQAGLHLTQIDLLPYFGCGSEEERGYLFIPDGSGSLVDFQTTSKNAISMPLYGMDYAVQNLNTRKNGQDVIFPIFGINKNDNGFVAIIENGDANATVRCLPRNDVYNKSIVYPSFEIQKREVYSSESMLNSTELVKYGKKAYKKDITVDYHFLIGEKAGYVGMAQAVQNKIFEGKQTSREQTLPLYLDTYGVVMRQERIIGYPVSVKRAMTTYRQAEEILQIFLDKGIKNINLRYYNWSMDQNENNVKKIGKIASVLGGKDGLEKLLAYTKQNQMDIFADEQLLFDRSSGLLADKDNTKMMDGSTAIYQQTGIIAETMEDTQQLKVKNSSLIVSLFPKLQKKITDIGFENISLSSFGNTLYSNFGDSTYLHRYEMQNQIKALLKEAATTNKRVMIDTGNYYTVPFVTDILNLPTSDSRLLTEKESVPFVQIVLHGYVSYAGQPLNLSDNYKNELLKSIEYGCGLRYALNFAQAEVLKNTQYSHLFSTNISYWRNEIIAQFQKAQMVLDKVQGVKIISHFSPQKNLYVTGYDNEIKIAVNYSDTAIKYKGHSVEAKGYVLIQN